MGKGGGLNFIAVVTLNIQKIITMILLKDNEGTDRFLISQTVKMMNIYIVY